MSNDIDDAPDDTVNTGDPYIVTDKMGNRLRWDENNATIHGFMHEIGEHCYRKQIIVPFFEEGVVPLPNGRGYPLRVAVTSSAEPAAHERAHGHELRLLSLIHI